MEVSKDYDFCNEIDNRLAQARAICDISAHQDKFSDEVPDDAIPNAMWAASTLIQEASDLFDKFIKLSKENTQKI